MLEKVLRLVLQDTISRDYEILYSDAVEDGAIYLSTK
jgi:hypothetical protein